MAALAAHGLKRDRDAAAPGSKPSGTSALDGGPDDESPPKRRVALVRVDADASSRAAPLHRALAAAQGASLAATGKAASAPTPDKRSIAFTPASDSTPEALAAWGYDAAGKRAVAANGAHALANGNGAHGAPSTAPLNGHGAPSHSSNGAAPAPAPAPAETTRNGTAPFSLPPPRGLVNHGATCYLNSVLQGLVHCSPFVHYVSRELPAQAGTAKPDALELVRRHVAALGAPARSTASPSAKRAGPLDPIALLRVVRAQIRGGSGGGSGGVWRQEDAHEALRVFLEALQRASLVRAGLPALLSDALSERTPIHHIFGGAMRVTTTCPSCGHESHKDDAFLDLSVDLARTVPESLAKLLEPETLSNDNCWRCDGCGELVRATRQPSFLRTPNVLVVHLKRFAYTARGRVKLRQPVKTPLELRVGEAGGAYDLVACVMHSGSGPNSGHYYCRARSGVGDGAKWFELDDESVRRVPASDVTGETQAYLLFFVRRGAWLGGVAPMPAERMPADAASSGSSPRLAAVSVGAPDTSSHARAASAEEAVDGDEEGGSLELELDEDYDEDELAEEERGSEAEYERRRERLKPGSPAYKADRTFGRWAWRRAATADSMRRVVVRSARLWALRTMVRGLRSKVPLRLRGRRAASSASPSTTPPPSTTTRGLAAAPPTDQSEERLRSVSSGASRSTEGDDAPSQGEDPFLAFSFDAGDARGLPHKQGQRRPKSGYDAWDAALDRGRQKKRRSLEG